jgi:DNA helicase HerA-like ATPase
MPTDLEAAIAAGYGFDAPSLTFGAAMEGDTALPGAQVRVPLALMNRHGLVAGATGTGKTKTLQVLAEQLSDAGVPTFISDIKGDISGLAAPAELNEKLTGRAASIGFDGYAPKSFPVEFYTLDRAGTGVRLRASVSSFGPILMSKVLDLNDTQQSVLALAFKYADDKRLPLLNLEDLRALLNHLNSDEGKSEMAEYGGVATATVGVIVRKIVELEQQEADAFFGSPEFDVEHFLRTADDGRGIVSILELADMQDRPALFSTFMMWLLASLYESLPEVGDPDKPKLVFFFDEAHLLFRDANKTFMQQIELVARLIPVQGCRRVLRHPLAGRCAFGGARPARQPRPARASRLHARRPEGRASHRRHLPADRALRRREGAHRARYR